MTTEDFDLWRFHTVTGPNNSTRSSLPLRYWVAPTFFGKEEDEDGSSVVPFSWSNENCRDHIFIDRNLFSHERWIHV